MNRKSEFEKICFKISGDEELSVKAGALVDLLSKTLNGSDMEAACMAMTIMVAFSIAKGSDLEGAYKNVVSTIDQLLMFSGPVDQQAEVKEKPTMQ